MIYLFQHHRHSPSQSNELFSGFSGLPKSLSLLPQYLKIVYASSLFCSYSLVSADSKPRTRIVVYLQFFLIYIEKIGLPLINVLGDGISVDF